MQQAYKSSARKPLQELSNNLRPHESEGSKDKQLHAPKALEKAMTSLTLADKPEANAYTNTYTSTDKARNSLQEIPQPPASTSQPPSHELLYMSEEGPSSLEVRVGDMLGDRYKVEGRLGEGTFCVALKCSDILTRRAVCVKVSKDEDGYAEMQDELKILRYLAEDGDYDANEFNLLKVFGSFHSENLQHMHLVTELLNENLHDLQERILSEGGNCFFTTSRVRCVCTQVLEALSYLHGMSIYHCDVKPENIVVRTYSPLTVALVDYGSACTAHEHMPPDAEIGTSFYRAPEILVGQPFTGAVDLWALACVCAEMLTEEVLFEGNSHIHILAKIHNTVGPLPSSLLTIGLGNGCVTLTDEDVDLFHTRHSTSLAEFLGSDDEDMLDLLGLMLSIDANRRPSPSDALRHRWLCKPDHHSPTNSGLLDEDDDLDRFLDENCSP